MAVALLPAACTSTPAAPPAQAPATSVTTSPTTTAAARPGSLANPRRLDCHNRNLGGLFVLEPRCVPLEIRPAGGRPVREVISFFAGDC
ncbi:MAG TPA: hypothetical protein VGR74_23445 [Actinomycetota bacterium]|nr:hypothetical protein [Actinomycetota bacterium]